jgi:endonuclease/exonuclease/phosphatase family metal-dependent hydrolase
MAARLYRLVLLLLALATALFLGGTPAPVPGKDVFAAPVTRSYSAEAHPDGVIRVISWNIDRGERFERVLATLKENAPDLCLLQEVDQHDRRSGDRDIAKQLAEKLHYNYAFGVAFDELGQSVEGKPAYQGQATLCRWPLAKSRILRFHRQSNWWKPHSWIPNTPFLQRRLGGRIALVTEITTGGRRTVIYNVHFESRSAGTIQTAQLNEVLADLAHYPPGTDTIIGGDFNSKYHPYRLLHSLEGKGFHNALGHRVERTHVLFGYLDWIFYRGPWQVEKGTVMRGSHASDHDPVVAELSLAGK